MSIERQMKSSLEDIRKDHIIRYELAVELIKKNGWKNILDLGCGIGYGSYMMSDYVDSIDSVEISDEAYEVYQQSYKKDNINFQKENVFSAHYKPSYDAIICFEFIEHIPYNQGIELIKKMKSMTDNIVISSPNGHAIKLDREKNPYHHYHYTHIEFTRLFNDEKFSIQNWYTQKNGSKEWTLNEGLNKKHKFMIVHSKRK